MISLAQIGFGEAGSAFAGAAGWGDACRAYDIKSVDYASAGVKECATLEEAVKSAEAILSLVTADQSLITGQNAAQYVAEGALYFDMNSVAPRTKQATAAVIEAAGGRYVDVAIMAPVYPAQMAVPMLVSGAHATAGVDQLSALGFSNVRSVGDAIGRASAIKMLRSVMYKGVEALTAECLLGCARAGVTDDVLASFGNDWSTGADYRLDRMLVHGQRRAAEMAEVVKTLEDLGVVPLMSRSTLERQHEIGALAIKTPPIGLNAKLERLTT